MIIRRKDLRWAPTAAASSPRSVRVSERASTWTTTPARSAPKPEERARSTGVHDRLGRRLPVGDGGVELGHECRVCIRGQRFKRGFVDVAQKVADYRLEL